MLETDEVGRGKAGTSKPEPERKLSGAANAILGMVGVFPSVFVASYPDSSHDHHPGLAEVVLYFLIIAFVALAIRMGLGWLCGDRGSK